MRPLQQHFLDKLADWQAERGDRQEFVEGQTHPAWHFYEMDQLIQEINRLRADAGKGPLDLAVLTRAEMCCQGHVDYTHKLALRAVELVHGP